MKKLISFIIGSFLAIGLFSCTPVNLYEKTEAIPNHAWSYAYKPEFHFTISDSTKPYQLSLVLRHTEKYKYNNIFLNLYIQGPGQDTATKLRQDLMLATNDKGWLASGMDDIYEHRIKLGPAVALKTGEYRFVLEQIMRDDPLEHVLDVGMRVEKSNQ